MFLWFVEGVSCSRTSMHVNLPREGIVSYHEGGKEKKKKNKKVEVGASRVTWVGPPTWNLDRRMGFGRWVKRRAKLSAVAGGGGGGGATSSGGVTRTCGSPHRGGEGRGRTPTNNSWRPLERARA